MWWLLSGLLGVLLLLAVYCFLMGVRGTELNPHTFEIRRFSFRRDPFTNYQLSGIRYLSYNDGCWSSGAANAKSSQVDPSIKLHLSSSNWLPQRWDLIQISDDNGPGGGANVLIELLNARDPNYDLFWPKWSIEHPSRAAEIWPAAQLLVEFRLYAKLPQVLELALLDNSLTELKASLTNTIQSALVEHCNQLKKTGDSDQLLIAAQAGLQYGDNRQLQDLLLPKE